MSLEFAFGGDEDNPYLPGNFGEDAVVYTDTHDNDTTMGWFECSNEHVRQHALHVQTLAGYSPDSIQYLLNHL